MHARSNKLSGSFREGRGCRAQLLPCHLQLARSCVRLSLLVQSVCGFSSRFGLWSMRVMRCARPLVGTPSLDPLSLRPTREKRCVLSSQLLFCPLTPQQCSGMMLDLLFFFAVQLCCFIFGWVFFRRKLFRNYVVSDVTVQALFRYGAFHQWVSL